jgi:hypothetical protein
MEMSHDPWSTKQHQWISHMKDPRKMGAGIIAGLIILVAVGVGLSVVQYRNQAMRNLFRVATLEVPAGSEERIIAVKKLGTFSGRKATAMLLEIALGRYPNAWVWSEPRNAAIKELRSRHDTDYSSDLASLLQPHENLESRQLAANALANSGCNIPCINSVLHYVERRWRGEPTVEERLPYVPDEIRKEQFELESQLDSVLLRHQKDTLASLSAIYGLGSADPSPYAIALVRRLHLDTACPALVSSRKNASSIRGFREPAELADAISALRCQ